MRGSYNLIFIALISLGIIVPLQININELRLKEGLVERLVLLPGDMVSSVILGGFRGVAADILWLRSDMYFHMGQWYKVLPIYRTITYLQPHFIQVWSVAGWHMAYNIYHEAKDEDKPKWLEGGLNFLKEGITQNPHRYELYFETGWTYFHKAQNYDEAIKYFRRCISFEHPDYIDRMIAHAFLKKGDIESAYREWQRIVALHPEDRLSRDWLEKTGDMIKKVMGE
jgi:tetratricopeptide (TPR) repeat protein